MRLWFAATLLFFSCAVFAAPENPAALIPDFFKTIAEFIGSVNSWIYGWFKESWLGFTYGEYQKMLEYDLGGITTGFAESYLEHPLDRSDYFQHYAAESVDSIQAAYSYAKLAAEQKSKCIKLYGTRQSCVSNCPTAYSVKTCTDIFFNHLNSATAKLNDSFLYAMRQTEADYRTYQHYGLDEDLQSELAGCYLSVVDVYNDFHAFQAGGGAHAEKVREEADLGDRIVLAFSSVEASPKFYSKFFNTLGGGKDSAVFQLLNQHQECRQIEKKVIVEFAAKAAEFSAKLGGRQEDFDRIKKEKFCELSQQDIDAIFTEAQREVQLLSLQISPEERTTGASPAQSCTIIAESLSQLSGLKTRIRTSENTNKFLVRSSKEIDGAEKLFGTIDENLNKTKRQTDGIGDRARTRAELQKTQILPYRREIPDSDAKSLLLSEFDSILRKADSAMQEARSAATEGERAKKYSLAIRHLLELEGSFGAKQAAEDAGPLLSSAEETLALAKEDGIEASRETALVGNAKAQMGSGRKLAASALLKAAAIGLKAKVQERYSSLPGTRDKIKSELAFLSQAGVSTPASGFNAYEKFFSNNELDFQKAMGSLKKMEEDYGSFDAQLSAAILSNQSSLLSTILSRQQPEILGDVVAGEPAQVSLSIEFENPLPFALSPKTAHLPLAYQPQGRISSRDVVLSSSASAAQEGGRLVLFVDDVQPRSGFRIKLLYESVVAQATDVRVVESHSQKTLRWKFSAKINAPAGLEKLLVPVQKNRYLLESFPQDFLNSGDRQYLVIWQPGRDYEREFSTPSGISIERKVVGVEPLQSSKLRISEKVSVKNSLDIRLDSVRLELPFYTGQDDFNSASPGAFEGANFVTKIDMAPRELKEVFLNYTIDDAKFYSEILLSDTDTRLSLIESRADAARFSNELAQLRSRREAGSRLYAGGNYGGAISELVPIGAEAARLENIANQNSAQQEAFISFNRTFSEKLSHLKSLNSLYLMLGTKDIPKDTKPIEDSLSRASREFLRGDYALALEMLSNVSMPAVEEKPLVRAIESRKADLSGRLDNFTRLRTALAALGKKDAGFDLLVENMSFAYGEFSRAASNRDYSGAVLALGSLNSSLAEADAMHQRLVSDADAAATELLENRSTSIEEIEKKMNALEFKNALSLHIPPPVAAWARENGITDESGEMEKIAEALRRELAKERGTISAALNMSPVSRLFFVGSKSFLDSDSLGRAQAFASTAQSLLARKEEDSAFALKNSEGLLEGARLGEDAVVLISSARRAQAAGRFQDSLAYTSYVVAVFSREPPSVLQYALVLIVLVVVVVVYLNRRRLYEIFKSREGDIERAERSISLRRED